MPYSINDLQYIGPEAAEKLKKAGIRTSSKLLEATQSPKARKQLAEQIKVPEQRLLCWANLVDRMRIKGVGEDYSELLREAGVDTVKELAYRNPANLAKAMATANAKRKLVRLLPSEKAVGRWIGDAKKLPIKISY